MSNEIIFFGNERLATGVTSPVYALRSLLDAGYNIVSVIIAQKDSQTSRKPREVEIIQIAHNHNIEVIHYTDRQAVKEIITTSNADIGILAAFGKIIPQEIIDLFPFGIINIHPSLLPRHRGPTPIESVILNGETKTGVSLMQLSAKMDSGKIFHQKESAVNGDESKQNLANLLLKIGSEMLIETLPNILKNTAQPSNQNDTEATYDKLITKESSILDWQKPAVQLEREVRAYAGWPKSKTTINDVGVTITKAHTEPQESKKFNLDGFNFNDLHGKSKAGIRTEPNTLGTETSKDYFMIDRLIPAGGKEMDIEAFLRGYRRNS